MRYALPIVSILFLLFTYWQINDAIQYKNHDNWFWIAFYITASALTFTHWRRPLPRWLLTAVVGFALGGSLFRMQDELGNFDFLAVTRATAVPAKMNETIQKPNEIGGLILVGAWFTFLAITREKAVAAASKPNNSQS